MGVEKEKEGLKTGFKVACSYPLTGEWYKLLELEDARLEQAAGRKRDYSGCGCSCKDEHLMRDLGWYVDDFADAVAMKDRLIAVGITNATVMER